jgi:hypothetical protein
VAEESAKKLIELAETRKGAYVEVEAKLPPGYTPPSAALAPSAEPVKASGADAQQGTSQAQQQE